ncbi:MAG: hypothetical protein LUH03_10015 [Oscillospiraceae bacterium]|nr:hypothetical protein [Oscillospiraceae bacterium]
MNYYKVLLPVTAEDGTVSNYVVDAQGGPNCVRYNEKKKLMLYCAIEVAQGIVDSFGNGTVWHVDGWPDFPDAAGVTETVTLELIDEETYTILHDALAEGQTVTDPDEDDSGDTGETDDSLEVVQAGKISAMSTACNTAITSGMDVVLEDGESHHFSLTEQDQLNLTSLQALILAGQTSVPYHADGELCRYFSAAEFSAVTTAATTWTLYHQSYFNSLRAYILALTDIKTIAAIEYGDAIPEEYQSEVLADLLATLTTLGATVG